MRTVITYGTFDLFHVGHVRLLERASRLGDQLYVGISTDAFNALKGKTSIMPFEDRAEIVKALRCVTHVFPESAWDQKVDDVRKYEADIFVMGDDWIGKFNHLNKFCKVIYLSRTEGVSSTEIKRCLGNNNNAVNR
ncbi:adenylyltransferase/cytidyltransferase family protein [Aquibaculum sediminis]|uniref:adenylyltransferase/cytidyltransferase family protein n=1 Tax=Aquibaculum sediminis TaxID=3231907 RepID=UPI003455EA0F